MRLGPLTPTVPLWPGFWPGMSFAQERDVLIVSDLLVPKQTGTSDTCGATNEEDIFAYQNDHNLLTLGWIHVRGVGERRAWMDTVTALTLTGGRAPRTTNRRIRRRPAF